MVLQTTPRAWANSDSAIREKEMKEQILSQARAVCSQSFPYGSGFDIVHGTAETHLIAYAPFGTYPEKDWEIVLSVDNDKSFLCGLNALMVELTKRLGDKIEQKRKGRVQVPAQVRERPHARAFYGPNYHKDSEFDVITSTAPASEYDAGYVAWVIVYPGQTASENAEWMNVLRTESKINVNDTYVALLDNLRGSMAQFTG
ncbi:uncharacterized protein J4E92_009537 [Alternaria infectoria]|uniref:uncharacterized protein n=1 Tax=Alternaria infectoria TaxID=45303 RepID=UPI0022201AE7|nr:uncharacterized protein J4E92_009537 [Alternaria infectoria]KAI4914338.1 hypothetical protein J4E92_009537 [Alternaria infectoria]